MNPTEWLDLENRLTAEMEAVLADTADQFTDLTRGLGPSVLSEIQPPRSIIEAAAAAAAAVFLAFEHGYQISATEEDAEPDNAESEEMRLRLKLTEYMNTIETRITRLESGAYAEPQPTATPLIV